MKPMLLLLALSSPLAWSAEPIKPVAPTQPSSALPSPTQAPQTAEEFAASRAEMARLQQELGALSKRMSELSLTMSDQAPRLAALRYLGSPNRAMVGIVMAESKEGMRIVGLTPDGPAARAGLKTGDIITAINGQPLPADDPDHARLQLRELNDGQKVSLGYRRDGKAATATLTASRREATNSIRLLADDTATAEGLRSEAQEIARQAGADAAQARRDAARASRDQHVAERAAANATRDTYRSQIQQQRSLAAAPWLRFQLTAMNPELGRYFGTDRGVLVLSTEGGALEGVKAGDVIQQIAGQPVAQPEQALRQLRDLPTDGKVSLQLMRDRKPLTLSVPVPNFASLLKIEPPPPPPAPPAPPAPHAPAPPAAPAPPPTPAAPAQAAAASTVAASAMGIDPSAPATIADVVAHPSLQNGMVSPGVAAKGDSVGAPGLWAGRIRAVETNAEGTCYRVVASTVGKGGRPVRGDVRGPEFSACTSAALDKKHYYAGRYASFLGTVTGPVGTSGVVARAARPTLAVTDSKAWNPMPDMEKSPTIGPTPPPQGW